MPEFAINLAGFHLKVGYRGFQARVPVYEAFVAIQQFLIIKIDKHFDDGL